MNEVKRHVWVGIFVFCGLVAFGWLVVMFGKVPTWIVPGGSYTVEIQFDSVSGIREGTMITMSGKEIGRVQSVQFVDPAHIDRGIKVVAAIEQRYALPKGARAVTSEAILGMGRPPIQIVVDMATSEYHVAGTPIMGRSSSAVETIFPSAVVSTLEKTAAQIGEAAEALTPVLRDMHELMEARSVSDVDRSGKAGNLASAAARLDGLMKHFNEVLGDAAVQSQLKEGVANFHAMTAEGKSAAQNFKAVSEDARSVAGEAKALMAKAGETMTRIDDSVQRATRGLNSSFEKASNILDDLSVASSQIRKGEGTIGKLVTDDRLFESMVVTFKRLSEMAEEFRLLVKEWQKGKVRVGL